MKRVALALAVCFWATGALADYTQPNGALGFPSIDYCRGEDVDYRASAGTLSTSGDPFFNSSSGTSATLEEHTPYTAPNGLPVIGSVHEELGTVATNDSGVRTATTLFSLGSGPISFIFVGRELAVSDGTNTFIQRLGLLNADAPVHGVFFKYDQATSTHWLAVIRDNGAETTADTGVTYTVATNRTFGIEITADGTSATFSIDGTVTNANVTGANMPDATDYVGVGWAAVRSAGTAIDINPMALDYIRGRLVLNTPRC